ncbi:MAG: hypothetical protein ACD_28C00244G0013 [uncultured bacterium]|nr:MAG: hypothetical protein ACD_28C00244G0013 [uncultured bacterium]KKT75959.1 MAG: hypothetical protein UW70_C0025G0007 [Candidatus Peregrinibacteria bacterium GW2011_GWA2_44_7]
MPYFKEFVHLIIQDLHLGRIPRRLKKSIEAHIVLLVDRRIEQVLFETLKEEDLNFYDHYVENHPQSDEQIAFEAMIDHRPEIQHSIENALVNSYEDIVQASKLVKSSIGDKN